MSITFANAKNGCQGSGSSTSTSAGTLSLFTSETTKGYNFYKNKSASNGKWEVAVFGRAHNYSSSAETYDYTIYVFARKLNSATSHGDFKVTFYYRDKSYSVTSSRYLQKSTGKVRLIASHTFDGLNCEPGTSTTIGAKVVGPSGTEAAGTITATDTADFSGGASWSVYVQSDSSIKLEGTNLTTNRGFRHAWVWQWKKSSASSYTTDATTNCDDNNTATSLSHTFSGLVRNTSYDVKARFCLRNYDPTDSTYNDPVPISSRTIVRTATTDKSDLSGSVSLSGNRYVGGTLTANVTNTDNASLAYQWCYNTINSGSGAVISGATSSTYTVTSDYVGKYIYCKVTFSKTDYNNLVIRKYTSDVVYKRTPAISVSISGNCVYDQTLTANITCDSTGTKTYQWGARVSLQASPTDISGATKSTYKIGSGFVGKYIGCNVSIAETDTYAATSSVGWFTSSAVVKATNPAKFPDSQSSSVTFSTNSQNKSFIGVTTPIGSVSYNISSQKNSDGVDVDYFSIPTGTDNSITIAAGTPAGTYTLDIGINVSGNADFNAVTGGVSYTLTINKASGSGSITMNGWTYGGTVTNPTPSSSTNGTSNVSYTWYDSDKTQLSAKPTSTSNAGTYYVKATFAATTNYNKYTTDYVPFNIAKANPTYTAPTLISNPKYSGSAVNYVNAGSTSHGAIYYYGSTTDVTPTPTSVTSSRVPTGLPTTAGDAQTYYAWFRIVGDVNHNDVAITKIGTSTAVQPGTFTVTKIPYSGSYDGSAHEASIKVDLAGCTVKSGSSSGTYGTTDSSNTATNSEVALGAVSRTGTGESIVYYQVTKDYYKTVTDNTTITINRANTAIEPTVANNLIYNTSEQTGVYGGNYISLAGTRTAINAGSYTATATPDSNHA